MNFSKRLQRPTHSSAALPTETFQRARNAADAVAPQAPWAASLSRLTRRKTRCRAPPTDAYTARQHEDDIAERPDSWGRPAIASLSGCVRGQSEPRSARSSNASWGGPNRGPARNTAT